MQLIASSTVVTGTSGPEPRALTLAIEDGRIVDLREGIDPQAVAIEGWIVPGFVDTHCHGAAGADFSATDPQAVASAIDHHRRHGSTTLFASTVTESMDEVIAQIGRLRPLVESGELAGIHLEGPFLSEAKKGAHNPELLADPSSDRVGRILDAAQGSVRMITLAPEREHGVEATARFVQAGVAVAFGHSDGDHIVTRECIDSGASVATHLFNAMRPVHHLSLIHI